MGFGEGVSPMGVGSGAWAVSLPQKFPTQLQVLDWLIAVPCDNGYK